MNDQIPEPDFFAGAQGLGEDPAVAPEPPKPRPDPWKYYRRIVGAVPLIRVIDTERDRQAFVVAGPKCRDQFLLASALDFGAQPTVFRPARPRSDNDQREIIRWADYAWGEAHPELAAAEAAS